MKNNENITYECNKLLKTGKILSLFSDILIPVGLIALMLLYALYPTVATILIPGAVAIIGFMLWGIGDAMQAEARERLENYYHEKMLSNDVEIIVGKMRGKGLWQNT